MLRSRASGLRCAGRHEGCRPRRRNVAAYIRMHPPQWTLRGPFSRIMRGGKTRMARPYGKTKKPRTRSPRKSAATRGGEPFKIKLRGRDGAFLTVQELRDCLFETLHRLSPFAKTHRAKWATLYL